MNNTNFYGQLQTEKLALESDISRKIVKEIDHFGINDRQRWLVIYYLAMELENIEEMKSLTSYIREVKGDELFITKLFGQEEKDG